jgi:demethylmenaquinone methyltransferase/2-methoxy-6-polyprenyl-1,4-benzoquinol methylase
MNDVLSFGAHRLWKHYTIATSNVKAGDKVLDIAGGTGDLARAFAMKVMVFARHSTARTAHLKHLC